jgi:hypothetical protein
MAKVVLQTEKIAELPPDNATLALLEATHPRSRFGADLLVVAVLPIN